jgi:hypothetical protein
MFEKLRGEIMRDFVQKAFADFARKISISLLMTICFALFSVVINAQTTLVNYSFNDAVAGNPCNAGTVTTATGVTSTFTTSRDCATVAGVATTSAAFTPNTAGTAVSLSNFANGTTQFFQFQLSGVSSFQDYMLYIQLRGSGTGATSVTLQYSLNGTTFTDFQTFATTTTFAPYTFDLSSIAAIEGQSTVYFRFVGVNTTGATGTIGTFVIDNFQVQAVPVGPTAAGVNISGRVATESGQGIGRAKIMLFGGSLSEPVFAVTDSDGNYSFSDVPAGETYTLSISVKGYKFNRAIIVVNLNEDVTDAHFTGTLSKQRIRTPIE